ncbi:MAG: hypothetical protein J2P37_20025 [Ktedonobacteraceae bacterium]|nr:hypothetical protein [Ktedonobacteraceae bacterium]MBO0793675.1 hypothetical protein [Ktedonobacteraceae bacterium]
MLVIAAHHGDPVAQTLLERWSAHGACLLTCTDLSRPGWSYDPASPEQAIAVIDGREVVTGQITGVLNRLVRISPHEITWMRREDREYAANEMNAFLLAWLSQLSCPVLNRPRAACLAGPQWRLERWIMLATRVGISVHPLIRHTKNMQAINEGLQVDREFTTITIVGENWYGDAHPTLAMKACQLAKATQAQLLTIYFSGPESNACLLKVDSRPDITLNAEIQNMVLTYLCPRKAGAT